MSILEVVKFNEQGLVPAIIQQWDSKEVLMVAYMNREALARTLATGQTWFWSRSRQQLWHKGETSGNYQYVKKIYLDCDRDAILILVAQEGVACHEGSRSCFAHEVLLRDEDLLGINADGKSCPTAANNKKLVNTLDNLYQTIAQRKQNPCAGSYTSYLYTKGLDKILKKVGEEAAEVIIAAKNAKRDEIIYEVADQLYHMLVLLCYYEIDLAEVNCELQRRRKE